ncbi:SDR family NAD(P)-dependent oxidoreductase [Alkaliphilus serpentinus]|uniref:SDR family oxidoreductase n=1 Tax=Alkaliphilus serpentinus TaxID=1482731 RepID=A0A833HP46_9FIRM|nr:SDR family oxidoreductase [Alkaliphilus serpentinus]KAB3530321.1 SDR family oxidoreductase [Alkaliphilus serpentinus]
MSFQDKVVIVTGGANGIGRCIAKYYGRLKAKVVVGDVDITAGEDLIKEIKEDGGVANFIKVDVCKPANIKELIEDTVELYGGIDILINNVGISLWKSPYELAVDEWDLVINTNLRSYFLAAREAAKYMKTKGGGAIVNIASTRGLMSEENSEAYAASKGGIIALTHALTASFSKDGIRVNCISPGWIETKDYEGLRQIDHTQHFSQRVGTPDDIAKACIFLTGEDNDFINGENIVIDGGMTKKMIYER